MTLKKSMGKGLTSMVGSLEQALNDSVEDYRKNIKQIKRSLKALETTDFRSATYVVNLFSCWATEWGKSTSTEYKGTLADAIKTAEEEFMAENHRSDVRANYFVNIKLAEREYPVPGEFWAKYKRKSS